MGNSTRDLHMNDGRHESVSDNTAGLCPEALVALSVASHGVAASYGDDEWTQRLCDRVRELFVPPHMVARINNQTVMRVVVAGAAVERERIGAPVEAAELRR